MSRLIDADALKSALWETCGYNSLAAEIYEFVDEELPNFIYNTSTTRKLYSLKGFIS